MSINETLKSSIASLYSLTHRMHRDQRAAVGRQDKRLEQLQTSINTSMPRLQGLCRPSSPRPQSQCTADAAGWSPPCAPLATMLPVPQSRSWASHIRDPVRLVQHEWVLYFLCSHSSQLAPCGPDKVGYRVRHAKDWVRKAAPVLKMGLVALKLALAAGGPPPLPPHRRDHPCAG